MIEDTYITKELRIGARHLSQLIDIAAGTCCKHPGSFFGVFAVPQAYANGHKLENRFLILYMSIKYGVYVLLGKKNVFGMHHFYVDFAAFI